MENKTVILKVLVGSQSHGLASADSDYDYRGVYVVPTREILSLGHSYKGSHWLEGEKEDQTAWEIGHFLHLATKCNPTILETFKAPVVYEGYNTSLGWHIELRNLFPYVWNPNDAFNAFVGYGLNQRKKMLDNHLDRWCKYAIAYLRTLKNLYDLLSTGDFSLKVDDGAFKDFLLEIKAEKISLGTIIDQSEKWINVCQKAKDKCTHKPDITKVNEFLIKIRKEFWDA